MQRPWRESVGLVPWLILIVAILALSVLIKRGVLPKDISDHTIGLIGAVANVTTTIVLIVGGILSYFKFFKGRTLSPKLIIIPNSGRVRFNNESVHWIEAQIENKGTVAIWNYQVTIYGTFHKDKDEHVEVSKFMPAPPKTEKREKLIDVGETVFEHAFLIVPETVSAITFQIVVTDKSKTMWWRCLTVSNLEHQKESKGISPPPLRRPTSHSTGRGDSISFMVLCSSLLVWIRAAPVNSSVRLLT